MEHAPRIEFETDVFSARGLTLLVDGSAQSHIDLAEPTRLFFEYVRRIGHVIDHHAAAGHPIEVLHLGGGALTLPRYVAATRPASRQVVVDFDGELVDVVRARAPWPVSSGIEVRIADAVDAVADAAARSERFDLVIIDLYTQLDAPGFVDDPGFLGACLGLLRPGGLVVVNIADAAGLARLRTAARAFARAAPGGALLAAGDAAVLDGSEEGNTILVAAPAGAGGGVGTAEGAAARSGASAGVGTGESAAAGSGTGEGVGTGESAAAGSGTGEGVGTGESAAVRSGASSSSGALPTGLGERLAAGGPFPATVLEGARLDFVLWGAC